MHIAHHPIFIALASLTAWLGAWTALDVFRRVRAHVGGWRLAWLTATAVAMGLSIWSMHFIAMLGFNPGAEVRYDVGRTVLSLLLAIATTAFAFFFARGGGARREIMGGVVMGAGICTMHYVGMSAVITSVTLAVEPVYVVLSFVVAISASTSALFVARSETTPPQRVLAAAVLAFAIVGMHYTAMFGVRVLPGPLSNVGSGGVDSLVLAVAVAAGTLFILLLALIAAISDRRFVAAALTEEQAKERVAAALAEKSQAEAALMRAQRLDALGRLTGGVAHDFNNLLTVVIGALDVILRNPEDAARRQRLGQAALMAARRGQRLTAQLLAFARQQPLQPELRELNALIRQAEPLLRRAMNERVRLTVRLSDESAVARIDPAQFEATLLNLIVNAVDASTSAGGEIVVETKLCAVAAGEVATLAPGQYFRMSVADDGQGMGPDVIKRIFEPFFTTKPPGKGTGLGLSQVYGFVKQSGGEIEVDSAEGAGTRFNIYLPVTAEQPEQDQDAASQRVAIVRPLNILLVEDDPSVAAVTDAMLTDFGHKVQRAANAEEAQRVLWSDAQVDVLFSDVVMPGGMNGVELAKHAVSQRASLKVLLTSGFAGESLDEWLSQGAWPFLRKPFLSTELAQALANLEPEPRDDSRAGAPSGARG
jgi:NO-binding membrane sensor protein with MHYT domain/nitrogen-specific signal transduction histidine kinase/ActR/RegA family two-component response regulator